MDIKDIKKNKILSFVCLGIAHVIAIIIGTVIGTSMTGEIWVNLLVAGLVSTIILFIFSVVFGNTSFFAPYWGLMPLVAVLAMCNHKNMSLLRFLLALCVVVWGGRLTVHWVKNFADLRREDWRTVQVRKNAGAFYPVMNFLGIHLMPSLVIFLCMLPVSVAFEFEAKFSALSLLFILIALGGLAIEIYADYHMSIFHLDLADGYVTGCCRYGLWKNSRHPNYLGEMIFWSGIAIAVILNLPSKWFVIIGPLALIAMFVLISIPMMETRLKGKAGYSRHFKTTHLLLPIPKKEQ